MRKFTYLSYINEEWLYDTYVQYRRSMTRWEAVRFIAAILGHTFQVWPGVRLTWHLWQWAKDLDKTAGQGMGVYKPF